MANIKDYGNGKYRVIVCNGFTPNGKVNRGSKTITAKSLPDAKKQAAAFEVDFKRGEKVENGHDWTFYQLVEKWRILKKIELAEKTKVRDEGILRDFLLPAFGGWKVSQIKALDIEEYINELKKDGVRKDGKEGGYSQKTIQHHYVILHKLFSLAVKWDVVSVNVCDKADKPKVDQHEAEFYEPEQIDKLLDCLEKERKTLEGYLAKENRRHRKLSEQQVQELKEARKYINLMHKVYVYVALASSCRRSEDIGLEWKDINLDTGKMVVCRATHYTEEMGIFTVPKLKNGAPSKTIYLPREVIELLKQYKEEQDAYKMLLGDKWVECDRIMTAKDGSIIHPDNISKWFGRFLIKYNLPKITLHEVRHTSISFMLMDGVDVETVAEQAGHRDSSVTSRIYGHVFTKNKLEAMESTSKMFKGRGLLQNGSEK